MSEEKTPEVFWEPDAYRGADWGLYGPTLCHSCKGEGWELDHEDECYETGDCNCTGVQMPCSFCKGKGHE